MFPSLKGPPGAGTIFAPDLPLAEQNDVVIGRYLADATLGRLFCVVDLRWLTKDGKRVRVAMLEDSVTEEIEPWEFGKLVALRRVAHMRPPDEPWKL